MTRGRVFRILIVASAERIKKHFVHANIPERFVFGQDMFRTSLKNLLSYRQLGVECAKHRKCSH